MVMRRCLRVTKSLLILNLQNVFFWSLVARRVALAHAAGFHSVPWKIEQKMGQTRNALSPGCPFCTLTLPGVSSATADGM